MKYFLLSVFFFFGSYLSLQAHEPFELLSSEKRTLSQSEWLALQRLETRALVDGFTLTFTQKEISLVVITGPEDDMLSYRIQGIRNPTIVAPSDAKFTIWFVNTDIDMKHDLRFIHKPGDFLARPGVVDSVGSAVLNPKEEESDNFSAEKVVMVALEDGRFKYYCSVGAHAKGGMWGNILIGVKPTKNLKQPQKSSHSGVRHKDGGGTHEMNAVTNINDPMERESSGTAWVPDSSPHAALSRGFSGGVSTMLMGNMFLRYTRVNTTRDLSIGGKGGRERFDAPTMFMASYSRPLGSKALVGVRTMLSLDPIIEKGYGYPLLYQSGEQFRGLPIHDRQHPHDLVNELAVSVSYRVNDDAAVYLYSGLPGEPALGPPMYLHRPSGRNNPDAPISHHWQDATHISYGVLTGGVSFRKAKGEFSVFNGTEPNENRYNFDRPKLNSYSGRFSVNPTRNFAIQVSHGYLRNPEPREPEIRILRKTSASLIHNIAWNNDRSMATSVVWGRNHANGEGTNSFLAEGNYDFSKNAAFWRFETVGKTGHDLALHHPFEDHDIFNVSKISIGYVRDLFRDRGLDVGLGGALSINRNPETLAPVYGGTLHSGWQLFLRLRPTSKGH